MYNHHVGRYALLVVLLGWSTISQAQTLSTEAWLDDFRQLKREMADHYANLDFAVTQRRMDLRSLAETTEAQLRRTSSDVERRRTIEAFLSAFGDGHVGVSWPAATIATPYASQRPTEPVLPRTKGCSALGFRESPIKRGLAFELHQAYRSIHTPDSRYFPIGVLAVPGRGNVGVLRIGLLDYRPYPEFCDQAAERMQVAPDSACGAGCAGPLERETVNLFTASFERQVRVLREAGVGVLLVDITNNDGGNDWAQVAPRVLTSVPLRAPRIGFIRHPKVVDQFTNLLSFVAADTLVTPAHDRDILRRAAQSYEAARSEASRQCPQDALWMNEQPPCPFVFIEPVLYSSGLLPYAAAGSLPTGITCCYLFRPARYTFHEGLYDGPLMVLVDRETASAAEETAAMLQDNAAALILGEPTYAAGCGYSLGLQILLSNTGATVRIPDCVRIRADGSNEVQGITPDRLIPWRAHDSPWQRVNRLWTALAAVEW